MKRQPVRMLRALGKAALPLAGCASRALGGSPQQDPGTDAALFVTATLTLVLIAALFLILVMPSADRERVAAAFRRLRRIFIRGSAGTVEEMDHDFDGIRELDNRIPPWFSTLFIGTVIFAAVYMLDYHVFRSSALMADEYRDEVAAADLQRRIRIAGEGTIDENTLTPLTEPQALQEGGERFKKYCISCHGGQGQGMVGPNLTDDYWIHGGGIRNVYTTIKTGVPAKGMISWQLVFTPRQIQELASYVLSLRGTNPPGAKKPEGTLYAEQDTARAAVAGR